MKVVDDRNIETERLILRIPTIGEQYSLWSILKTEIVNRYYIPTPSRFNSRKEFQESLNDWEKQRVFFERKINNLDNDSDRYTWSIFLKTGEVIGQMTVQPNKNHPDNPNIRNVGWFINPKYQGKGYAYEAAKAILDFMFNVAEIEEIKTSAVTENPGSWRLMEKLGMMRTGVKESFFSDEYGNKFMAYTYYLTKEMYLSNNQNIIKKL